MLTEKEIIKKIYPKSRIDTVSLVHCDLTIIDSDNVIVFKRFGAEDFVIHRCVLYIKNYLGEPLYEYLLS